MTRERELNLENQIRFTKIVEYQELSMFYRLSQFVIVPTLFDSFLVEEIAAAIKNTV